MIDQFTDTPTAWTTDWTEALNTGTWRSAVPVHARRLSPCHAACPVGSSIPEWIRLVESGEHESAWLLLVENNPLPGVTGRVCHHPCEAVCNRPSDVCAVNVNALEQFVADRALQAGWALPAPAATLDQRVAVVGGGPAGLSCAYHLRRLGYQVTLFEAQGELGGLLRSGIPAYRLSRQVLDGEIERLLALGIHVRLQAPVEDEAALARLLEEYDAVFAGIGAQRGRRLAQLAACEVLDAVVDGLDFLARANAGLVCVGDVGRSVVVVGGGSAAIDAARSAWRLGADEVRIVYRRERVHMPASMEEIRAAEEEGVLFDYCAAPVEVATNADGKTSVRVQRLELCALDESGRPCPVPIEGSEYLLDADLVIACVGQDADLQAFGALAAGGDGVVQTDELTQATSRPGLFAGGDVASAARYVSEAMGHGKRAAYGIAAYLGHPDAAPLERPQPDETVPPEHVNLFYFDEAQRRERSEMALASRPVDLSEVTLGFGEEEAAAEASRCLTCGTCIECDTCVVFCPDMALEHDVTLEERYRILDQYCKGCGICAAECPRGVIRMTQETR
jgi:NADPH-dependent glutamate synthase beta subunit-like oxidoreductase